MVKQDHFNLFKLTKEEKSYSLTIRFKTVPVDDYRNR